MVSLQIDEESSLSRGRLSFVDKEDLPPRKLEALLKELAAGGLLLFRGKPLLIDLFTPLRLEVELLIEEEQALASVTCYTKVRSFTLTEAAFLTKAVHPLILYRGTLYQVATELPLSFLEGARQEKLFPLETLVQLGLCEESEKPSYAELHLEDPRGAFAKVYFHYHGKTFDPLSPLHQKGRDLALEKRWVEELAYKKKGNVWHLPLDQVASHLTTLLETGWKITTQENKEVCQPSSHDLVFSWKEKQLVLEGSVTYQEHKLEGCMLEEKYLQADLFAPLDEVKVALLPSDTAICSYFRKKQERSSPAFDLLLADTYNLPLKTDVPRPTHPPLIAPHTSFQGQLRPYQIRGLSFFYHLYQHNLGGLLADEMGLGKTVQTLAFLSLIEGNVLLVAPKSLLHQWEKEAKRFLPTKRLARFTGSLAIDTDILLISYTQVRLAEHLLSKHPFAVCIADEAQEIKNKESQTAKALCSVRATSKFALTGTPVQNQREDLLSLSAFLLPDYVIGKDTETLTEQMKPFILRREKKDVLQELPKREDNTFFIAMLPEQQKLYNHYLQEESKKLDPFTLLLRLRQIACHPKLVGEEMESGKTERILHDLSLLTQQGEKVLVYSQFTTHLQLLTEKIDLPYLYLDGQTKEREQIVTLFQTDPAYPVLFSSLKVGGVGLNLTRADHIFLIDPWWNQAVEEQAISRAHRLGRTAPITTRRYYSQDTIEEKIIELQEAKVALSDELLLPFLLPT